jgi:hypothetical protein
MPVTNAKKKQEIPFSPIHRTYHYADKGFLFVIPTSAKCSFCCSNQFAGYCKALAEHQ